MNEYTNNENQVKLKEMVRVVDNTKPYKEKKHPEERVYLICIDGDPYYNSEEDKTYEVHDWGLVTGRTDAYEFVKSHVLSFGQNIDFDNSFIMVEGIDLTERRSLVAFMKYCEQFFQDGFSIDDYVHGDWDEEAWASDHNHIEVSEEMAMSNLNKLDVAAFMNGEIDTTDLN